MKKKTCHAFNKSDVVIMFVHLYTPSQRLIIAVLLDHIPEDIYTSIGISKNVVWKEVILNSFINSFCTELDVLKIQNIFMRGNLVMCL